MALALILLAAAGLTLKSFWRAQNAPLGFDPHGVLTMNLSLPKARYPTDESIAAFNAQLIERLSALPGVAAAAIGANIPFDDTEWDSYVHITGTPEPEHGKEPSAEINIVSPDYFRVLGMPILRGARVWSAGHLQRSTRLPIARWFCRHRRAPSLLTTALSANFSRGKIQSASKSTITSRRKKSTRLR